MKTETEQEIARNLAYVLGIINTSVPETGSYLDKFGVHQTIKDIGNISEIQKRLVSPILTGFSSGTSPMIEKINDESILFSPGSAIRQFAIPLGKIPDVELNENVIKAISLNSPNVDIPVLGEWAKVAFFYNDLLKTGGNVFGLKIVGVDEIFKDELDTLIPLTYYDFTVKHPKDSLDTLKFLKFLEKEFVKFTAINSKTVEKYYMGDFIRNYLVDFSKNEKQKIGITL